MNFSKPQKLCTYPNRHSWLFGSYSLRRDIRSRALGQRAHNNFATAYRDLGRRLVSITLFFPPFPSILIATPGLPFFLASYTPPLSFIQRLLLVAPVTHYTLTTHRSTSATMKTTAFTLAFAAGSAFAAAPSPGASWKNTLLVLTCRQRSPCRN